MISHCIPAAGIAGLIKTALALHHRVLPPTLCEAVNPELGIAATPFYVNTEAGPWIARLGSVAPRRRRLVRLRRHQRPCDRRGGAGGGAATRALHALAGRARACSRRASAGGAAREARCASPLALGAARGHAARRHRRSAGARDRGEPVRLALVAKDATSLVKSVEQARDSAARQARAALVAAQRRVLRAARPRPASSRSCSRAKARSTRTCSADLALCFDEVQQWLDFWHSLYDRAARRQPHRHRLPPRQRARRGEPEAARCAPARHGRRQRGGVRRRHGDAVAAALARRRARRDDGPQLRRIGGAGGIGRGARRRRRSSSRRSCASSTRSTSGCWPRARSRPARCSRSARCRPRRCRRRSPRPARRSSSPWTTAPTSSCCTARRTRSRRCRRRLPGPARSACRCRSTAAITRRFRRRQRRLPRLLRPHQAARAARAALLVRLDRAVPDRPRRVRKLAAAQWSQTVRFRETIEQMVADGVGCFVEVGPSGNLTAFVNDIPAGKAQTAIASNLRRRDGVEQLLTVLAQLYASGRPVRLQSLFAGRRIAAVDLARRPTRVPTACCSTTPCRCCAIRSATARPCRVGGFDADAAPRRGRAAAATAAAAAAAPSLDVAAPEAAALPRKPIRESEPDPRADVMAEYFDVMRGFLEQQRAVVESWQGAAGGRHSVRRRPRVADLPFSSEIARARRAPPRRALPPEPRRQLPAQPRALRPGLGRRAGAARAWRACR